MEKYDICLISVPEDGAVAETLAQSIRSYRLPWGVKLPDPALDYRRIYVDSTGSDLDEAGKALLENSGYLIIICSPDAKHAPAILQRLNYFRSLGRSDKVVAVIVRGEPVDAFPESFIPRQMVRRILPNMRVIERMETIEPVAADLRGDTPARCRQLLRYETVRITASVLGLHPDNLERRHRRRRNQAILTVSALICSVLLVVSGIFLYLGSVARKEGRIAEAQTTMSLNVAQRLTQELPALFADDPQALGYIQEAINQAQTALDEIVQGKG